MNLYFKYQYTNMNELIGITFKAGQRVYFFIALGLYDVSNLTEEGLIEFKKPFVESFKRVRGISAATDWIY